MTSAEQHNAISRWCRLMVHLYSLFCLRKTNFSSANQLCTWHHCDFSADHSFDIINASLLLAAPPRPPSPYHPSYPQRQHLHKTMRDHWEITLWYRHCQEKLNLKTFFHLYLPALVSTFILSCYNLLNIDYIFGYLTFPVSFLGASGPALGSCTESDSFGCCKTSTF
jgi:hypothetical protein